MSRRLPSQPPVLPGFTHVHVLGSGGFADVFLYEQNMPRRKVAVKVMLSEIVDDQVRQMFQAEANLMAQLSSHPSILTVHQAGVCADGRPFLVMELCSPSLSERYRRERIPVPEVLQIAIRIGSAIETAHRQGVLHRDIKPSNILLTAYGHPVLSDFGIAATLSEAGHIEAVGMSIPWSAPEVLMDETSGTIASEVWSLGATIYSLLAGRSPFEIPGQSNSSTDLISRINRSRVQPIGRSDVPDRLERLLHKCMSKKPSERPNSVLEVIRQLQSIEASMGLQQTPIDLATNEWATASISELEDRTRVKSFPSASHSVGGRSKRRRVKPTPGYEGIGTLVRETADGPKAPLIGKSSSGRAFGAVAWLLIACAVLVLSLGVVALSVLIRSAATQIPRVTEISATASKGSVEFSWVDPGVLPGDSYQISSSSGSANSVQQATTFSVGTRPGERVCITIRVNRQGALGEPSDQKCADDGG